MAKRGGAIFWNVDATTGAKTYTLFFKILVAVGILALLLIIIVPSLIFGLRKGDDSPSAPTGGGRTMDPTSDQPGRINIATVAQAPSSGQAIIYFNKAEGPGVTCDECTAEFDVNLTYSGGTPNPPPAYQKLTSPTINGTLTFDYSVPTQNAAPPTQVNVSITARSVKSATVAGAPTTFNKTIPYI